MPGRTEKKKRQGTYTPAFKGGKRGQNAQNAGRKTLRHATRGENWSPRLSTYDLSSPSPTSYVYLHVYPRTDLGYVYSPPSLGAVVVSTPTSDKPLILFIKREINIASRCPPRRRRRCTQREAKGEGAREEEIGECGRWTFKTDRVSPSTPLWSNPDPRLSLVIPNVAECGMKLVLNPPRSDAVERDPRPVTGCRTFRYSSTWPSAETRLAGDINVVWEGLRGRRHHRSSIIASFFPLASRSRVETIAWDFFFPSKTVRDKRI